MLDADNSANSRRMSSRPSACRLPEATASSSRFLDAALAACAAMVAAATASEAAAAAAVAAAGSVFASVALLPALSSELTFSSEVASGAGAGSTPTVGAVPFGFTAIAVLLAPGLPVGPSLFRDRGALSTGLLPLRVGPSELPAARRGAGCASVTYVARELMFDVDVPEASDTPWTTRLGRSGFLGA